MKRKIESKEDRGNNVISPLLLIKDDQLSGTLYVTIPKDTLDNGVDIAGSTPLLI